MAVTSSDTNRLPSAMVPPAGQHGGDGPAVAAALGLDPTTILDLSKSMNPFAPSIRAMAANHLDALTHYPSTADGARLVSEALGVETERLRLTNGGSEAIALVATELGGRVHSEPEFALHPRNADGPLWRSDPHNPTGQLAGPDDRADVWDEAFYPLAAGRWSAHRPGVVVGSLTKVFDCPGLRLGYVIADDVDDIVRQQPQWSVNSLALAVLPELLEVCDLTRWRSEIAATRTVMTDMFEQRGFAVDSADAPWILVDAPDLRTQLAPEGVIVRDCTSFGLSGVMRVGVTDEQGLEHLATALDHARVKHLDAS